MWNEKIFVLKNLTLLFFRHARFNKRRSNNTSVVLFTNMRKGEKFEKTNLKRHHRKLNVYLKYFKIIFNYYLPQLKFVNREILIKSLKSPQITILASAEYVQKTRE